MSVEKTIPAAQCPIRLVAVWIGLPVLGLLVLGLGSCARKVESISNSNPEAIRNSEPISVADGDWPWWAGPDRNFVSRTKTLEDDCLDSSNIAWKLTIEDGTGHSSPIVVGDRILMTCADEARHTKSLVCVDLKSGQKQWSTVLHQGPFMHAHQKNSQASATPASDGQRVFTAFMFDSGIQVSAVDLSGNILWQTTAGGFQSRHGFGSSPVLYRSLVIVAGDNPGSGFISALDRETGEIVWRIPRSNESSYATPIVQKINGREQLLISGAKTVTAYDPATGEQLWSSEGPAQTTANTVVTDGRIVFSGGGYPEKKFMAIDPETASVTWSANIKNYVPSPLVCDDHVLVPQDSGILGYYRMDSGESIWKLRLREDISGSPVRIGDRILIGGERGTLFLVQLGQDPRIIARSRLDSRIMSTPVVVGGRIFVRTAQTLYAFANSPIENSNSN